MVQPFIFGEARDGSKQGTLGGRISLMKQITIAGGGLAGLTLGIGLRKRGVPVVIVEAGTYPRRRVCGEFISGKGLEILEGEGLKELLVAEGARLVSSMKFVAGNGTGVMRELREPGLAFPRLKLDDLLARTFRALGGELKEGERWPQEVLPEGMVRATGRRIRPPVDGWRYFGLKAHARGAAMEAGLEVYLVEQGYVGLCQVREDLVNVCGLFRSQVALENLGATWPAFLKGPPDSPLGKRLRHAEFVPETFCSIAGLPWSPDAVEVRRECRIGDCLTMIPPVTGNGMSMAFESAAIAVPWLCAYSQGELSWEAASEGIGLQCATVFGRRIRWARVLHRALFEWVARKFLVGAVARYPRALNFLYGVTR
jgi:menaquinone-9 beta-reductase